MASIPPWLPPLPMTSIPLMDSIPPRPPSLMAVSLWLPPTPWILPHHGFHHPMASVSPMASDSPIASFPGSPILLKGSVEKHKQECYSQGGKTLGKMA